LRDWQRLETDSSGILALRFDWRGRAVITVHNFADRTVDVPVEAGENAQALSDLWSPAEVPAEPNTGHRLTMEPCGYRWFRTPDGSNVARRGRR
jgi:maltose alpha-D-glucosyltransferase/alpha-amylase